MILSECISFKRKGHLKLRCLYLQTFKLSSHAVPEWPDFAIFVTIFVLPYSIAILQNLVTKFLNLVTLCDSQIESLLIWSPSILFTRTINNFLFNGFKTPEREADRLHIHKTLIVNYKQIFVLKFVWPGSYYFRKFGSNSGHEKTFKFNKYLR